MHREIVPRIHWIYEPGNDRSEAFDLDDRNPAWYDPNQAVYIPQCAYLVRGSEQTLLFDTLSPASTEDVLTAVDDIVGEHGLDYLVVSHPDVPHAGNTHAILRDHPETQLVAPAVGNDHELYRLDEALHVTEGDELVLGDRTVTFHEATFPDAPISIWMSERTTRTLFTVDWMGFPHLEETILTSLDESDRLFDIEQFVEFHSRVLFWYHYVDVEKVQREIDALIQRHDPAVIAPAHGLVIREDATDYMERMKDVPQLVEQRSRVGTLG